MSPADNFCKQFGTRAVSKLFVIVFLKEFFEKVDFEKNQQTTKKKHENYPGGRVKEGFMQSLMSGLKSIITDFLYDG